LITNFRASNYNFRLQLQLKVHSLERIPPAKLKKIWSGIPVRNALSHHF